MCGRWHRVVGLSSGGGNRFRCSVLARSGLEGGAHRGILGVMTLVHFPQASDAHPSGHVPPVGAAVEAFFVHRDLAPNSRRVYRAALDPLVAAVGADQPLGAC